MSYQVQINLKYNPETDGDVINALRSSGSPVDYVRRLVRQDLRFENILNSIDAGKKKEDAHHAEKQHQD